MPLPTRKPPTTPTKPADAPAAGAKTRLPALPNGGLKPKKTYQYLNIPKDMDRCFYLVKLVEAKQMTSEKDNMERVLWNFEVLDTNVPDVKVGSEISTTSDLQGKRALYFWSEFAQMTLALSGVEATEEELATFSADCEATYSEVVDKNALAGSVAMVKFRRGLKKDGNPTFYTDWEAAEAK